MRPLGAPKPGEGMVILLGGGPGFFFTNTSALCAISCILAIVSPFILSVFYVFIVNLTGLDLQVFLFL